MRISPVHHKQVVVPVKFQIGSFNNKSMSLEKKKTIMKIIVHRSNLSVIQFILLLIIMTKQQFSKTLQKIFIYLFGIKSQ